MPRVHPSPPRPHRRAGFTLIELLTVILIIGVLAAILLPVLGTAREHAKAARCGGNLRIVFQSVNLYAADHDGYYPAARFNGKQSSSANGRRNYSSNGIYGNSWEAEIKPYVGVNLRSVADADGAFSHFAICSEGWTGMNGGIVVGTGASGGAIKSLDYQYKPTRVDLPAKTVLAGDSDDYHLGVWKGMKPGDDGLYTSGDPVRHAGRANYLFFDGHVESLSLDQALRERWY